MIIITARSDKGMVVFKYYGTINMYATEHFVNIDAQHEDKSRTQNNTHVFDRFYTQDIISIRGE